MKNKRSNETSTRVHGVTYTCRWGPVPEPLLEDTRLSLDTRAVAAWLAVKPAGWHVNIRSLRRRLAAGGKEMLGKDKWLRMSSELEVAGYLCRTKSKGPGGQWLWETTFNPVPPSPVNPHPPMAGKAGDGYAGTAPNGNKEIPNSDLPNLVNTTTTTCDRLLSENKAETGGEFGSIKPIFEPSIVHLRTDICSLLSRFNIPLDSAIAQDLVDELAGAIEAGRRGERIAIVMPGRWFREIVMAASSGTFDAVYYHNIQKRRAEKHRDAVQDGATPCRSTPEVARANISKIFKCLKREGDK